MSNCNLAARFVSRYRRPLQQAWAAAPAFQQSCNGHPPSELQTVMLMMGGTSYNASLQCFIPVPARLAGLSCLELRRDVAWQTPAAPSTGRFLNTWTQATTLQRTDGTIRGQPCMCPQCYSAVSSLSNHAILSTAVVMLYPCVFSLRVSSQGLKVPRCVHALLQKAGKAAKQGHIRCLAQMPVQLKLHCDPDDGPRSQLFGIDLQVSGEQRHAEETLMWCPSCKVASLRTLHHIFTTSPHVCPSALLCTILLLPHAHAG